VSICLTLFGRIGFNAELFRNDHLCRLDDRWIDLLGFTASLKVSTAPRNGTDLVSFDGLSDQQYLPQEHS
jgi:hypothetical protein